MEHNGTILIVDEEVVGRKTLKALLMAQGCHLALARNGPEALTKTAERQAVGGSDIGRHCHAAHERLSTLRARA